MSQSPNTRREPSFDDPVDPGQVGDENDSRYLEWLKLHPDGNLDEWRREHAKFGTTRTNIPG
jgi:hypothetical protein